MNTKNTWQHAANEWADAATNGIQALKNVRDGISTADECIALLQADIEHARRSQPATDTGHGPLSSRLRAGVECAPWVIDEVIKLEQTTQSPRIEDRAARDVEGQRETFDGWLLRRHGITFMAKFGDTGNYISPLSRQFEECWQAALASATHGAYPAVFTGELNGKRVGLHGSIESVEALNEYISPSAAVGEVVPVAKIRHFNYSGIARNGFSQEPVMLDDAPVLPEGTLLYSTPTKPGHMVVPGTVDDMGMLNVPCKMRNGWLYIPHADGNFVTAAKLVPFSLAILESWKAMLNATQGGKGEGE